MANPTVCTVSGVLRDSSGTLLSGATVQANGIRAYVHPTDSSLIVNYQITTTTASDGTWSLNLVETLTPNTTITISFLYSTGSGNPNSRADYTIQVPNQASATFASLIGSQV